MTEVVAALIWEGGKFMICQRPERKARGLLWEFVGGKVEPGETKEQALVRECRAYLADAQQKISMLSQDGEERPLAVPKAEEAKSDE